MNKMIVLPGTISSNFFTNELPYIKKHFEIAAIIAYQEPAHKIMDILSDDQLPATLIKDKNIKVLFSRRFWKWLFCKDTIREIRQNVHGKCWIKKLFYILYYGCFCTQACQAFDQILGTLAEGETIYLYSYWLSRPAYAISYYRMTHMDDPRIRHIISRAHGYDLYVERNGVHYLPFRQTINSYLDSIHFISEDGRKYFQKNYPFSREGASKQVSRLGTYNKEGFYKKIYSKQKICIISCSAARQVKRLDLMIDLFAQLKEDVHWIHIGDGELLEEMKAYAAAKLPAGKFTFLGQVDNDKILEQYEKYDADFFLNLSDSEGIPVSMMEAMSYGLPCIGRNVGGMGEIIDETTGLLLPSKLGEITRIQQFIQMRLGDVAAYTEISGNCRIKWETKYNALKNYETFFGGLSNG